MTSQQMEEVAVATAADELLGQAFEPDEPDSRTFRCDTPRELAAVITEEYGEENLQRLAEASVQAAMADVQPNPSYADVIAKGLARDAVRYALGLKPLPTQEGE